MSGLKKFDERPSSPSGPVHSDGRAEALGPALLARQEHPLEGAGLRPASLMINTALPTSGHWLSSSLPHWAAEPPSTSPPAATKVRAPRSHSTRAHTPLSSRSSLTAVSALCSKGSR